MSKMYWPDFFKFNSMRFLVFVMLFALIPFPGYVQTEVGMTQSVPGHAITADVFSWGGLEPTKHMLVLVFESYAGAQPLSDYPGFILFMSYVLLLLKIIICYALTGFIFYYDRHALSEDSPAKKVKFKF